MRTFFNLQGIEETSEVKGVPQVRPQVRLTVPGGRYAVSLFVLQPDVLMLSGALATGDGRTKEQQ